ncbi:hypothetical protein L6164_035437 [Bauhinia variegata]|uniref:Uncharacterized protein n=1 Tax=Bauhinia variegata TaxID=167791 RepID=A0ACB9KDY3_BAUVA|nr:hypothetical protein L6164_035437 [Bauhinia variegata]
MSPPYTESCPSVRNFLLLDSEGKRVAVKYYSDDWPTNSAKEAFEKAVFTKTQNTNARTEFLQGFFDAVGILLRLLPNPQLLICLYLFKGIIYIDIVALSIPGFPFFFSRGNVDKKEALENLDLILLCLDEIIDGGIILETDPSVIANKVASNMDSGAPLSEQTLSQALATAREHLTRSLFK